MGRGRYFNDLSLIAHIPTAYNSIYLHARLQVSIISFTVLNEVVYVARTKLNSSCPSLCGRPTHDEVKYRGTTQSWQKWNALIITLDRCTSTHAFFEMTPVLIKVRGFFYHLLILSFWRGRRDLLGIKSAYCSIRKL